MAQAQLTPPVGPDDHAQGPGDAPVTLVEYGDYQCPDCGAAHPIVRALQAHFGGRLRFVFRHFPLTDLHSHAQAAAQAAEAAALQGKFWEMHDTLLDHQRALTAPDLQRYAVRVGLDAARFTQDATGPAVAARVRADAGSAERSGAPGTPTFFLNGRRHDGSYDLGTLTAAIESAA